MVPNVKISSSTLSDGRTTKLVCTPCKSDISHEENTRSMQLEIDCLRRRLRREQRRTTPSYSDPYFDDDGDGS